MLGADPAFSSKPVSRPVITKVGQSIFLWQGQAAREQKKNTQDLLRLSHYSRQVLHQLLSQSALEFAHRESGKLVIYTNPQDFDNAKARVAQKKRAWGCKQEILTPQECIAIQPSLKRLPKPLAGGIYAATDEVGDPHRFANQLLDQLVKDTGFEARFNCRIEKLVRKRFVGAIT
ncbi:FAD-dependent oxidoreductase [Vibrio sinaloensis]|nr:FAD-dependent oxidoreductase [Vibrio sinaloensis]